MKSDHPFYKEDEFSTKGDYTSWKDNQIAKLSQKIKQIEKIQPFSGNVKIQVLKTRNLDRLIPPEQNVKLIPNLYITIKVDNEIKRTSAYTGSWNCDIGESFKFELSNYNRPIIIEVYNKKLLRSMFLGRVIVNLKEIMWEKMPYEKWYTLSTDEASSNNDENIKLKINVRFRLGPSKKFDLKSVNSENKSIFSSILKSFTPDDQIKIIGKERKPIEELKNIDYYYFYKFLISIILLASKELDKNNKTNHDPTLPSKELLWILDNYRMRYNISLTYHYLIILDLLISSFNTSCTHLTLIHYFLMELSAQRNNEKILLKRESQLYDTCISNLKTEIEEALSNYFLRFPKNEPKGSLSTVIALYYFILGHDSSKLYHHLNEKTEMAMIKMYKCVVGDRPTEESLIEACKFVSDVMVTDRKYFNDAFPSEINHAHHSVKIYYSEMLTKNIHSLLRTSPPISDGIMTLYHQLKKLNNKVKELCPNIPLLSISEKFQPFVSKWLEKIGDQMKSWCKTSLETEDWKPVSLDASDTALYSSSVQTLFEIINDVYILYKEFEMRDSKDFEKLLNIIENTLSNYVKEMTKILNDNGKYLTSNAPKDMDHNVSTNESFNSYPDQNILTFGKLTQHMFTRIMNLEVITRQLYNFCMRTVEDGEKGSKGAVDHFSELFNTIKNEQTKFFYYLSYKFNETPSIKIIFQNLFENSPDVSKISDEEVIKLFEPLFNYINDCVKLLCENLNFKVCLKALEYIIDILAYDFTNLLFPTKPGRKFESKNISLMDRIYPYLIEFFRSDIDGLTTTFIESKFKTIGFYFEMMKVTSHNLIQMYTDLEKGLKPQNYKEIDIDPLLFELIVLSVLVSRKGEKESKKFAKSKFDDTTNRYVIRSFGLASTETVVDWFTCTRREKKHDINGYFFITTNFACFDTLLPSDHKMYIPFSNIKAIKKEKYLQNGFTLILIEGSSFFFHSASKHKAYDIIYNHAIKTGSSPEKIGSSSRRSRSYSESYSLKRNSLILDKKRKDEIGSDHRRSVASIDEGSLKKDKRLSMVHKAKKDKYF